MRSSTNRRCGSINKRFRRCRFIKSISLDPDVGLLESYTADAGDSPRGKCEIAGQSDELQITGRKDDSGLSYSRWPHVG